MYEDTYTKFDPATFEYGQYRQKFITGDPPYAEWDYGDTLHLYFNIKDALEDPNTLFDLDYLDRIFVVFTIFNYRYEVVYEACETVDKLIDAQGNISIDITYDLSEKMKPGTYNCSIYLQQENIKLTVVRASDCVLHVR